MTEEIKKDEVKKIEVVIKGLEIPFFDIFKFIFKTIIAFIPIIIVVQVIFVFLFFMSWQTILKGLMFKLFAI